MSSVYEVIDTLRQRRHLSQRKLAELAGILPNTMTTLMTRKPLHIPKKYLEAIAPVFGMKWFELLNLSEKGSSMGSRMNKLPSTLTEEDVAAILARDSHRFCFFVQASDDGTYKTATSPIAQSSAHETSLASENQPESDAAQYKRTIILMLDRLNAEGLLEAMHQVVAIACNPDMCK